MAVISKGIKLSYGKDSTFKVLTNLMEIPELGGDAESIEITVLTDDAHMYEEGILNYGDSLPFKFLYEEEQFDELQALTEAQKWKVELPNGKSCTFGGKSSVKLDGIGVNAALTYTLAIKPNSKMDWA